jgi:hypothetical protein
MYDPLPPFGGGPPRRGTVSSGRAHCPPSRGTAAERRQGVIQLPYTFTPRAARFNSFSAFLR